MIVRIGNGMTMPSRSKRVCKRLTNSCLTRYWSTNSLARRMTVNVDARIAERVIPNEWNEVSDAAWHGSHHLPTDLLDHALHAHEITRVVNTDFDQHRQIF